MTKAIQEVAVLIGHVACYNHDNPVWSDHSTSEVRGVQVIVLDYGPFARGRTDFDGGAALVVTIC